MGAGVSGLLLARELLRGGVAGSRSGRTSVLLVDPRPATSDPVTLAYWAAAPTVLDGWALRSWRRLVVVGREGREQRLRLGRWRYTAVSWTAARRDLLAEVAADPRVTLLPHAVDDVRDGADAAAVRVQDRWLSARWVYDSRPAAPGDDAAPRRCSRRPCRPLRLVQAFAGVWVRPASPASVAVDTRAATLMDFSTDDGPDLGFSYVLPVEADSALVMAVKIGAAVDTPDPLPAVARAVGHRGWQLTGEERGATPLLTPPRRRREGNRILAIGVRGGRARPSTGYAVTRIVADAAATVHSLRRHGHPFAAAGDRWRDRTLDAVWLHALARERSGLEPAFASLFERAPVDSVLGFLDGHATPRDLARVIAALPPGPFLRAVVAAGGAQPSS